MRGICWRCGNALCYNNDGELVVAERKIDGNPVKMHKDCAKQYDEEFSEAKVTARERKQEVYKE
jgi:hypothetical protein